MFDGVLEDIPAIGSNLAARDGDAAWMFLLPTLAPRHVLCVGDLPVRVTDRLRESGADLTPVANLAADGDPTPATDLAPVAVPDLLLVSGRALAALDDRSALADRLRSVTAGGDCAVVGAEHLTDTALRRLSTDLDLEPVLSMRTGDPNGDPPLSGRLLAVPPTRSVDTTRSGVRKAARAARLLRSRIGYVTGRGTPTRASRAHASDLRPLSPSGAGRPVESETLLVGKPGRDMARPPRWVVEVGEAAGVDFDDARWTFAPARGYRSQKPLFLLAVGGAQRPTHVVKVTQEARFNPRLRNEAQALMSLRDERLVDPTSIPELLATAEHGGLAVVLQTAWDGQAFREHSTARVGCPFARRAVEWFTVLGERSAVPDLDTDAACRGALRLVERYLEVFDGDSGTRSLLVDRARQLQGRRVPGVLVHGDPGNWNMLARRDGSIGVLDWENARRTGPPIWDVALFLKTYGSFVARAEGRRQGSTATFVRQFTPGAPMRRLVDDALSSYASRLGIDGELVPTLVMLCWVHQALKDASRLPTNRVTSSPYHQIVRRCLAEPALLGPSTVSRR